MSQKSTPSSQTQKPQVKVSQFEEKIIKNYKAIQTHIFHYLDRDSLENLTLTNKLLRHRISNIVWEMLLQRFDIDPSEYAGKPDDYLYYMYYKLKAYLHSTSYSLASNSKKMKLYDRLTRSAEWKKLYYDPILKEKKHCKIITKKYVMTHNSNDNINTVWECDYNYKSKELFHFEFPKNEKRKCYIELDESTLILVTQNNFGNDTQIFHFLRLEEFQKDQYLAYGHKANPKIPFEDLEWQKLEIGYDATRGPCFDKNLSVKEYFRIKEEKNFLQVLSSSSYMDFAYKPFIPLKLLIFYSKAVPVLVFFDYQNLKVVQISRLQGMVSPHPPVIDQPYTLKIKDDVARIDLTIKMSKDSDGNFKFERNRVVHPQQQEEVEESDDGLEWDLFGDWTSSDEE